MFICLWSDSDLSQWSLLSCPLAQTPHHHTRASEDGSRALAMGSLVKYCSDSSLWYRTVNPNWPLSHLSKHIIHLLHPNVPWELWCKVREKSKAFRRRNKTLAWACIAVYEHKSCVGSRLEFLLLQMLVLPSRREDRCTHQTQTATTA